MAALRAGLFELCERHAPLTLRNLFYLMVSAFLIAKTVDGAVVDEVIAGLEAYARDRHPDLQMQVARLENIVQAGDGHNVERTLEIAADGGKLGQRSVRR